MENQKDNKMDVTVHGNLIRGNVLQTQRSAGLGHAAVKRPRTEILRNFWRRLIGSSTHVQGRCLDAYGFWRFHTSQ